MNSAASWNGNFIVEANRLDPLAAGGGGSSVGRAPVRGDGHALDQAGSLQVVDQAGDVARRDALQVGQPAQADAVLTAAAEGRQQSEASVAETLPLGPAFVEQVQEARRSANGRDRLEGGRSLAGADELAHALIEETTPAIPRQTRRTMAVDGLLHSPALHYLHGRLAWPGTSTGWSPAPRVPGLPTLAGLDVGVRGFGSR